MHHGLYWVKLALRVVSDAHRVLIGRPAAPAPSRTSVGGICNDIAFATRSRCHLRCASRDLGPPPRPAAWPSCPLPSGPRTACAELDYRCCYSRILVDNSGIAGTLARLERRAPQRPPFAGRKDGGVQRAANETNKLRTADLTNVHRVATIWHAALAALGGPPSVAGTPHRPLWQAAGASRL
jgi:hypothetical protein